MCLIHLVNVEWNIIGVSLKKKQEILDHDVWYSMTRRVLEILKLILLQN